MTLRTRWLVVVSLTALVCLAFPGSAVAGDGISFLGNRELTITLADTAPATIQVKVINGSAHPQDVYLDLVTPVNRDGVRIPPDVLPQNMPLIATNVASGTVATFDLTFAYAAGLSASYSGQLVTYGDDGTLDRINLTLIAREEKPAQVAPDTARLEPDFLETVTLAGINRCPSPLARFGKNCVAVPPLLVNDALSKPRAVVGSLSGGNGGLGQVVQDGAALQVEGITQAGEYAGQIDLLPDDDDRGGVGVKLYVRDVFWWPLLTLVAGLAISSWLNYYARVIRPQKQLEVDLKRLKERALRLQDEAEQVLPTDWPFEKNVTRIYGKKDKDGLLTQAADGVIDGFKASKSDAERARWGPGGDEFKRVQGYVDALPGLYQVSRATFKQYQGIKECILHFDSNVDPGEVPVLQQTFEAIEPGLITSASQLQKRQEQLKAGSGFAADFLALYRRLVDLINLAKQSEHKTRANALMGRLLSKAVVSADWLTEIDAGAKQLELDIQTTPDYGLEKGVRLAGRPMESVDVMESLAIPIAWPTISLPDVRKLFGLLRRVEEVSEKTSKELQEKLGRLDWAFNGISGAIVVVTGLSALYLGNATFGSLADYASLLLWGTVVDEGFKLARQLAPGLVERIGG